MSWFLDGLAIIFILLLGYNGYNKGLIEEFGRLIGLVLAILISISNARNIANKINDLVLEQEWIATSLSFISLFVITLLVARGLTRMFNIQ